MADEGPARLASPINVTPAMLKLVLRLQSVREPTVFFIYVEHGEPDTIVPLKPENLNRT